MFTRSRGGELATLSKRIPYEIGPIIPENLYSAVLTREAIRTNDKNHHNALCALQKESISNGTQKDNLTNRFQKPTEVKPQVSLASPEIQELASIIDGIADSQSTVKQQYGRDLLQSLEALKISKKCKNAG
jgi:hypothetical protein